VEPTWPPFPLGTAYWDITANAGEEIKLSLTSSEATTWGLVLTDPDGGAEVAQGTALQHTVGAGGVLTVGVVNLGPEGLDADDALETASFQLTVERIAADDDDDDDSADDDGGGCACTAAGRRPGATWLVALLLGATWSYRRTTTFIHDYPGRLSLPAAASGAGRYLRRPRSAATQIEERQETRTIGAV
jgi:hypothetical protein